MKDFKTHTFNYSFKIVNHNRHTLGHSETQQRTIRENYLTDGLTPKLNMQTSPINMAREQTNQGHIE